MFLFVGIFSAGFFLVGLSCVCDSLVFVLSSFCWFWYCFVSFLLL